MYTNICDQVCKNQPCRYLIISPVLQYGTAQRQLDTRTRSTGRTPAVKISSARYVHAGTRKGFARHEYSNRQ